MLGLDIDSLLERVRELARQGMGWVEPNPCVGAIVLKDGEIVGEGFHRSYGGPHAEVMALKAAGDQARGGDLIVTMEPCTVQGKTAPCADAILATGIRRVIYASEDPNPANAGKARAVLENAGIEVHQLPPDEKVEGLLEDFKSYLKSDLPWVLMKWAMSCDGKVATVNGDSRWISGETSRREVHEERHRSDAILVGRVTVKTDDPELTVRNIPNAQQPVRVILDSSLHLPPTSKVAMTAKESPTWVIHAAGKGSPERRSTLEALGVRLIEVPCGDGGRLDPSSALRCLRSEGLNRILVEGGPTVHGTLLSEGLANWARVYVAPLLLGGIMAPGPVAGGGFPTIEDGGWLGNVSLRVVGAEKGSDLVMEGRISNHRK